MYECVFLQEYYMYLYDLLDRRLMW